MSLITIEWLDESHECEACGVSYAEGARITLDGGELLKLVPTAHCFGGANWSRDEVYGELLKALGHTVEEVVRG